MTIEEMNRIKEERGYSFKMLSDYSGVPEVTLQKIFSGTTKNPRVATLDAIERVLSSEESIYHGKAIKYTMRRNETPSKVSEALAEYGAKNKQGEYTIEDYYRIPDEQRVELIDGVFWEMNSPRMVHQDIASYVHMVFYNFIRDKKKPCKVFEAPTDVQICCDNRNMVQPDVLVICDRDKIKGFGVYGAPDFILEILSKSTRKKDMGVKLNKYMEAGVREYWIIDPDKRVLIVHNFMDEEYIPLVYELEGSVPVAISEGELEVDLAPVLESIEELGGLE